MARTGRPTKFTQELADKICEAVATTTLGLKKLCASRDDLPDETTVQEWRYKHNDFSLSYAKAKLRQADLLAEDCLNISDDSKGDEIEDENGNIKFNSENVARSRLRVDTRKWLASKLLPKQYGDIKVIEDLQDKNEQLRQEVLELRAKLDAEYKKEY